MYRGLRDVMSALGRGVIPSLIVHRNSRGERRGHVSNRHHREERYGDERHATFGARGRELILSHGEPLYLVVVVVVVVVVFVSSTVLTFGSVVVSVVSGSAVSPRALET